MGSPVTARAGVRHRVSANAAQKTRFKAFSLVSFVGAFSVWRERPFYPWKLFSVQARLRYFHRAIEVESMQMMQEKTTVEPIMAE